MDPEGRLFCGFIQFFLIFFLNLTLFTIINGFQNIRDETPPPPNSCCAATSALLRCYNHCRVFPQSHIVVAHARSPHYALMHRLDATGRGSFLWRAWICPQEEEMNAVAQDPNGVARLRTPTCVCHVRLHVRNRCSSEAVSVEV